MELIAKLKPGLCFFEHSVRLFYMVKIPYILIWCDSKDGGGNTRQQWMETALAKKYSINSDDLAVFHNALLW